MPSSWSSSLPFVSLLVVCSLSFSACATGSAGSPDDSGPTGIAFEASGSPVVDAPTTSEGGGIIVLPGGDSGSVTPSGGGEDGGVDAGLDATVDAPVIDTFDATVDADMSDVAQADAGADAGGGLLEAGPPDVRGQDAALDAPVDGAGGALPDGASDAPSDAPSDATVDAPPDASPDAPDAAAHDAAVDASGPACSVTHLVISQVQSRGPAGGADEWVEIDNPTSTAETLDATWAIEARSYTGASFTARWTATSLTVPSHAHLLVVGSAYSGSVAADAVLSTGITDASAVRLVHGGAVVDEVCFGYSAATKAAFTGDATYACPGPPATNPHDDTTGTDTSASLERAPGGAGGNCTDTGSSLADFRVDTPSMPHDLASPPAP